MKRKIVRIDEEKCTGCGLCVDACHEGALQLVDGKARLMSESYCDGLGNCLPECPDGAITIEEREAADFDEEAVKIRSQRQEVRGRKKDENIAENIPTSEIEGMQVLHPTSGVRLPCWVSEANIVAAPGPPDPAPQFAGAGLPVQPGSEASCGCGGNESASAPEDVPEKLACGCPGTSARLIEREECAHGAAAPQQAPAPESQLRQWPCQIRLAPVSAPYLDNADLLVAADCTAYAHANIHSDFMRGRITLIGCPKLDDTDYAGKLTEILKAHEIRSIKVLRMEVPCCGGIVNAVKQAIINSGRMIPWGVVTIGTDGRVVPVRRIPGVPAGFPPHPGRA